MAHEARGILLHAGQIALSEVFLRYKPNLVLSGAPDDGATTCVKGCPPTAKAVADALRSSY